MIDKNGNAHIPIFKLKPYCWIEFHFARDSFQHCFISAFFNTFLHFSSKNGQSDRKQVSLLHDLVNVFQTSKVLLISKVSPLTHWGQHKMAAIFQTTFSNAFSWMKMYELWLRFHWFFSRGWINNIPALVQIMAWRRLGDKPLSEPMMVGLPMHICVTRPQGVKSC